jgi:hypothetical protein
VGVLAAAAPALAGTGIYWYATDAWFGQGQTYATPYDTCTNVHGAFFQDNFSKGSNDYGTVMFIDNTGYNWHATLSGYGNIVTSDSNYGTYTKKAAGTNNAGGQNLGYYGTGGAHMTRRLASEGRRT